MPKVAPALLAALMLHIAVSPARASDEFTLVSYSRLGQAVVFDSSPRPAAAFGFGLRGELDRFAIDVSGLNLAIAFHPVDTPRDLLAGSLLKIEVLRYLNPYWRKSLYLGGGVSWGQLSAGRQEPTAGYSTGWTGSGLQSEFTVGYEVARKTPVRFFVQADASAPLFLGRSETYNYSKPGEPDSTSTESRYFPSVVVSAGVGWRRR